LKNSNIGETLDTDNTEMVYIKITFVETTNEIPKEEYGIVHATNITNEIVDRVVQK